MPDTANISVATATAIASATVLKSITVRLKDLDVAPENPRFLEGPDDLIPDLATSLAPDAAGLLVPLLVRAGVKKEKPFMALDGRRRLFGFRHLLEQGLVPEDLEIAAYLCETKESIAAAAITANQARLPLKPAEIILAIRALAAKKITVEAMSRALCVDLSEARRYHAVSQVHMDVLLAYKDKLFDFDALKLIARIPSAPEQRALAKLAREQGMMRAYQIRDYMDNDGLSAVSSLMQFVGMDDYLAAGGRKLSDLLEEMPDTCLDADVAMRLWSEKAAPIQQAFASMGIEAFISADDECCQPDGFEEAPYRYNRPLDEKASIDAAQANLNLARDAVNAGARTDGITPGLFLPLVEPQHALAIAKFAPLPVRAVQIRPGQQTVLDFRFFTTADDIQALEDAKAAAKPASDPSSACTPEPSRNPDPLPERKVVVDTSDRGHAFHRAATDAMVRGFRRCLSDSFIAALKLQVASQFQQVVLVQAFGIGDDKALQISCAKNIQGRSYMAIDGLDKDLVDRLVAYRDAYVTSGLRPYAWVSSLGFPQLQDLLALMTAANVWVDEERTDRIKGRARSQIQEVAEELDFDLRTYWYPDGTFYARASKKQLLRYAAQMGCDLEEIVTLKKGELANFVAEQGVERRWHPSALSFENDIVEMEADDGDDDDDAGAGPAAEAESENDDAMLDDVLEPGAIAAE